MEILFAKAAEILQEQKGIDMRQSEIIRKTAETDICLSLLLDGTGRSSVNTGVGFLDHADAFRKAWQI